MNNLSSYCGLVDAKIRASDKDLPVHLIPSWLVWTEIKCMVHGVLSKRPKYQFKPVYSHLFKRGAWNKRGGGAKFAKLLNVELGINVEGGIFGKN